MSKQTMAGKAEDARTVALRRAVEYLALPGSEGLSRRGCALPDQLALDFDHAYTAFMSALADLPALRLLEGLQELDRQLESMSDPAMRSKWTREGMVRDPDWEVVRALALEVLAALDAEDSGDS
jgi:hypothetical protein